MGGGQSAPIAPVPQWVTQQQASYQAASQFRPTYTPPPATNVYTPPQLAAQPNPFGGQQARQLNPNLIAALGTGIPSAPPAGGGPVRAPTVGAVARPVQAPVFRPHHQSGSAATAATRPVTMAQLAAPPPPPVTPATPAAPQQKFMGGYFTGGPDDDPCPTGIIFLLLLIIIISIAIVLSSYSSSEGENISREKMQGVK